MHHPCWFGEVHYYKEVGDKSVKDSLYDSSLVVVCSVNLARRGSEL